MAIRTRGEEEIGLTESQLGLVLSRVMAALEFTSLNWAQPQTMSELTVEGGVTFVGGAGAVSATLQGDAALSNPTFTLSVT